MKIKLMVILTIFILAQASEPAKSADSSSNANPSQAHCVYDLSFQEYQKYHTSEDKPKYEILAETDLVGFDYENFELILNENEHFSTLTFRDLIQENIKNETGLILAQVTINTEGKETQYYYDAHTFNTYMFGENYFNPNTNRYTSRILDFEKDPKTKQPILNQIFYYIASFEDNRLIFKKLGSDYELHVDKTKSKNLMLKFLENIQDSNCLQMIELFRKIEPNSNIEELLELGITKFYARKYASARSILELMLLNIQESSPVIAEAQFLLGFIYYKGKETPTDFIKAQLLFTTAANSNNLSDDYHKRAKNRIKSIQSKQAQLKEQQTNLLNQNKDNND
ncbi:MAG: DUF5092 domain-containing protein [Candidatus Babeliales bacterium]|nr:DUF5092 domain-containing protein [Candidatus Babeliales bacterium]